MLNKCRICKADGLVALFDVQSPYFDRKYKLYHCNSCLCRTFDPEQYPDLSLEELYEDFVENNSDKVKKEFSYSPYWNDQVRLLEKLKTGKINSVLDIGCRTGDFLMHLPKTVEKHGVELSKKYSEICLQREIITYTDFVENISFSQKFDVVSAYALLEHLQYPDKVLKTMKNVVNDNGIIVILVPWYQCFKEKFLRKIGVQWHMFTPPEHLNYYSKEYLISYFTEDGTYELVKQQFTSGGLINPFRKIPVLKQGFSVFMKLVDKSFINKLAIFDHLFLYFRKVK